MWRVWDMILGKLLIVRLDTFLRECHVVIVESLSALRPWRILHHHSRCLPTSNSCAVEAKLLCVRLSVLRTSFPSLFFPCWDFSRLWLSLCSCELFMSFVTYPHVGVISRLWHFRLTCWDLGFTHPEYWLLTWQKIGHGPWAWVFTQGFWGLGRSGLVASPTGRWVI